MQSGGLETQRLRDPCQEPEAVRQLLGLLCHRQPRGGPLQQGQVPYNNFPPLTTVKLPTLTKVKLSLFKVTL